VKRRMSARTKLNRLRELSSDGRAKPISIRQLLHFKVQHKVKSEVKQRIKKLREVINRHRYLYHGDVGDI